jgi:hypothetical protein
MKRATACLPAADRTSVGPPLVVDTHVHIHECFELGAFMTAAAANFARAIDDLSTTDTAAGALFLTEVEGTSVFDDLSSPSTFNEAQLGDWQPYSTPDPRVLLFEAPASMPILMIAGRQIRTREGLEVLALGCREVIEDGLTIDRALEETHLAGALPIVPWGFGKWTLARGETIRRLIDDRGPEAFCLGDVGGRWQGLPEPSLLVAGRQRGFTILPGSDPLPFAREVARPGSSGVVLPRSASVDGVLEDLLHNLQQTEDESRAYMHLESLGPFIRHQIRMQMRRF